jgi:DNA-binding response OmpR family regulator
MVLEAASGSAPRRILVADDEPHIRRILSTLLRNASFDVDEAADGGEALALMDSESSYDFVLLDLMMPVANGLEVLKAIRGDSDRWATPVIILTAKGQDTDRDEALEAGADDFLTKPFSPKKLLARIQEILAGH